ncbi:MAG: hypothetical protein WAM14_23245 [Candidatus Nitrosopolaris sp.]
MIFRRNTVNGDTDHHYDTFEIPVKRWTIVLEDLLYAKYTPLLCLSSRFTISKMSASLSYNICEQILKTDKSIRFTGIANNMGVLIATAYREELVPLMTKTIRCTSCTSS